MLGQLKSYQLLHRMNEKVHVVCNLNCLFKTDAVLKITDRHDVAWVPVISAVHHHS